MSVEKETSVAAEQSDQESSPGLSRRRFLGGAGTVAAAAMAGGSVGFGNLIAGAAEAEAREVGPLIGIPRLEAATELRKKLAERMKAAGIPVQTCNGDEDRYPSRIGNYSKGLPHDSYGEVIPSAYQSLLNALTSGVPADFELIQLGAGGRKLTNPQSGLAYDTEGIDPHQAILPPAPAFASAEEAGEAVELYWMALLRDLPFTSYNGSDLAEKAAAGLSALSDFRGPKIEGKVTPQTLFRDKLPGATTGPYISQFLLRNTPFGAEYVERKMRTLAQGDDHMTTFDEWLAVQNGFVPGFQTFDPVRRYIRNGRDLAQWVHIDVLFQAYFNACLILGTPPDDSDTGGGIGCPVNPGNPYRSSETQEGFGTWGPPSFKALLCEAASRALKAVWFQKWFVHRRLRPEVFGGRVEVHLSGRRNYPIHGEVLGSGAVALTKQTFGSYLLPMVFPEGSPTHPAYGAGHATVAGACVTILKALFDESFPLPDVLVPSADGTELVSVPTTTRLTVGGELNKLASNVATGRNIAGVHWRSDGFESLKLGEAVAIALLRDHKATFNEGGSCIFTKFDGTRITL